MNVALVTPRYEPHSGGVETHVQELAERLATNHEVTVVTADWTSAGGRRDVRNGVSVHRCRGFAPGNAFHIAPGVTSAVSNLDADIVHVHNYHALPAAFAEIGSSAPVVVTPHYHGESASAFRNRLLRLYRPIGGRVLRNAAAVLAVGKWERDRLWEDFGVDAMVVPNGIDVARFREAEPYERSRPYLLTVGRLVEYKGVQHAIRALTQLDGFDLLVAGSGPYGERLREIATAENVADRVEFLGYVPDEQLPSLYAGAEAYVTLSSFEAYGLTVGEALAAGTPCVVRSCRGLSDWTEREDCIGLDVVRPKIISDAILSIVNRSASSRGIPTWEDTTEKVLTVYQSHK